MGRLPRIAGLPENVREELHGWLRDPGISQKEAAERLNALLAELGRPERVSRQAVNRYDLRMRAVCDKLRQTRQIAESWIDRFGSAPGGKLGHLVTEMLRSLAFDIALQLENADLNSESLPGVINAATKVSLLVQRLELASEISARRERRLKREAAEELAAKAAADTKRGRAITPERLREIIRDAYGL